MPHTSTMIYVDQIQTPNLGVSIYDMQQVFGISSKTDIGGIYTNANINPWAKYKPVRANVQDMLLRDDMASLGLGNAGGNTVGPVYATNINGFIALYTDGETNSLFNARANGWRYWRPRGLSYSEWFRKFDLVKIVSQNSVMSPVSNVGYDHSARNPFGAFNCTTGLSRNYGSFSGGNGAIIPSGGTPEYDITIGDINAEMTSSYRMLYYGIMLVPQTSGYPCYLIFNNDHTINDANTNNTRGGEDLSLDSYLLVSSTVRTGLYTAYPFLTNMVLSSNTRFLSISDRTASINNNNPRLYSLPGSVPKTVNIYDTLVVINVYATAANNAFLTRFYITIQNNGTSDVTISNLVLKWRLGNKAFSDARATGEVFYDGQYRYDDSHPSGTADNTYAEYLRPSTAYTIPANGGQIRIPTGDTRINGTVPSREVNTLFVGNANDNTQYGSVTIIMPAGLDDTL